MKVIYEPKGKAGEYGELAVNLYNGCGHGCVYCYAPSVVHKSREEFFGNPQPRRDIIAKLEDDVREMVRNGDRREVFLCFTCDPFQPLEQFEAATHNAILLFEKKHIRYRILTKTGYFALDTLRHVSTPELCTFGTTLVFHSDIDAGRYEPNAGTTSERIHCLIDMKNRGFKTWVSLEPVWTPEDAFELINRTYTFVDEYKIGKLNYHPQSKNVNWVKFAKDVSELCKSLGCKYILKDDLAKLLEGRA